MLLAIVLISLIGSAPLLIAVAVAVLSRDARRRADARRVVSLLRRRHPPQASAAQALLNRRDDSGA